MLHTKLATLKHCRFNPKTADANLVSAFEDVYDNFEWKQLPYASQLLKQLNVMKRGKDEGSQGLKFVVGVITNNDERVYKLLEKEGFFFV